jgi:hypothetical protein
MAIFISGAGAGAGWAAGAGLGAAALGGSSVFFWHPHTTRPKQIAKTLNTKTTFFILHFLLFYFDGLWAPVAFFHKTALLGGPLS